MTLRQIALILVIAVLIGSSAGVVTAETQENNGHPCEDCDSGRDWQNHPDDPGRDRQKPPDKAGSD